MFALLETIAVVLLLAGLGGTLLYVGGSFLLMRSYTDARPAWVSLREALREGLWVILSQPLLPLGYVLGRRMGGRGDQPIVLIHGYGQNRYAFLWLARALRRAGLGPIYGFNYPFFRDINESAARLGRFIERVLAETGRPRVDLVCHSLGSLVGVEYLAGEGSARVRRCVTIAGPHGGVAWLGPIFGACGPQLRSGGEFLKGRAARALGVPCLSIYSTHDNIVHPPRTSSLVSRGGRDLAVDHLGHLSILFDRGVADHIIAFLRETDAPRLAAPAPEPRGDGAAEAPADGAAEPPPDGVVEPPPDGALA
jgi:pimeloyl-ACP methyl ester carboxylesterase